MAFFSLYDVHEILGKGGFGTVRRCVEKSTGHEFAVKVANEGLHESSLEEIKKEARICRKLQHPNVIRYVKSFGQKKYLIFDLVVGGELMVDIEKRKYYSETDASYCMNQILSAISYCHGKGVVHRDLKPENILLASKTRGAPIKIADFGLAIKVVGDERGWFGSSTTPYIKSPEVSMEEDYGKPVDIWACGVIMYLLLVGVAPFDDESITKLNSLIRHGTYNYPPTVVDEVSEDAKHLISQMLTVNSYQRITADQALKHIWISQREQVAPKVHLQETVDHLKKFNARRKFKAAILAAVASMKFKMRPKTVLEKDVGVKGLLALGRKKAATIKRAATKKRGATIKKVAPIKKAKEKTEIKRRKYKK